jgi:hypothetical protein
MKADALVPVRTGACDTKFIPNAHTLQVIPRHLETRTNQSAMMRLLDFFADPQLTVALSYPILEQQIASH